MAEESRVDLPAIFFLSQFGPVTDCQNNDVKMGDMGYITA
jgi:hypothetical protein